MDEVGRTSGQWLVDPEHRIGHLAKSKVVVDISFQHTYIFLDFIFTIRISCYLSTREIKGPFAYANANRMPVAEVDSILEHAGWAGLSWVVLNYSYAA